jgi:hypothetical protein
MSRRLLWLAVTLGACTGTPSTDKDGSTDVTDQDARPTDDTQPTDDTTDPPDPQPSRPGDLAGETQGAATRETSRFKLDVSVGGVSATGRSSERYKLNVGVASPQPTP